MNRLVILCLLLVAAKVNAKALSRIYIYQEIPFPVEDVDEKLVEKNLKNIDEEVNQVNTSAVEAESESKVSYKECQLWKAQVDDKEKIQLLVKLREEEDISIWGGNISSIDILVKPKSLGKVKKTLSDGNLKYDVVIPDLQQAIEEENPPVIEHDDRRGHQLTWGAYHRLKDIHGYLDFLAETYPNLCSTKTIGNSVQGRAIKILKISNGNAGNKAIWIDGGIHAREWISPATVTFIINNIIANYEKEPNYIQNVDWYIVPVLNPDGYEFTHISDRLWRKNRARGSYCMGVDLNRNFGYQWGGSGVSKNPCTETYGGSGPFSEPESAAVQRYMTQAGADWKAYISFHSYGQYILYPWGYNRVVPPDYKDLELVGKQAAQAIQQIGGPSYTVGPAGSTLYPAAGGSDDWAKGSIGIKYAYTIELRDSGRYGFVLPAKFIQPTAQEALAAVRVIAKAAYST